VRSWTEWRNGIEQFIAREKENQGEDKRKMKEG
jgi:hypothetical protein